jgi:hypothetical protein
MEPLPSLVGSMNPEPDPNVHSDNRPYTYEMPNLVSNKPDYARFVLPDGSLFSWQCVPSEGSRLLDALPIGTVPF